MMIHDSGLAAKGYLSTRHKRRFVIAAGVLGGVAVLGQILLPFIFMISIMMGGLFSSKRFQPSG